MKPQTRSTSVRTEQQIRHIRKALRAGLILVLAITVVVTFLFDIAAARAAILGSLLAWVAQLIQAWFSFRYQGARQAGHVYASMWRGQFVKWLVVMAGFAAVYFWLPQKTVSSSNVLSINISLAAFPLMGFILVTLAFVGIFWRKLS